MAQTQQAVTNLLQSILDDLLEDMGIKKRKKIEGSKAARDISDAGRRDFVRMMDIELMSQPFEYLILMEANAGSKPMKLKDINKIHEGIVDGKSLMDVVSKSSGISNEDKKAFEEFYEENKDRKFEDFADVCRSILPYMSNKVNVSAISKIVENQEDLDVIQKEGMIGLNDTLKKYVDTDLWLEETAEIRSQRGDGLMAISSSRIGEMSMLTVSREIVNRTKEDVNILIGKIDNKHLLDDLKGGYITAGPVVMDIADITTVNRNIEQVAVAMKNKTDSDKQKSEAYGKKIDDLKKPKEEALNKLVNNLNQVKLDAAQTEEEKLMAAKDAELTKKSAGLLSEGVINEFNAVLLNLNDKVEKLEFNEFIKMSTAEHLIRLSERMSAIPEAVYDCSEHKKAVAEELSLREKEEVDKANKEFSSLITEFEYRNIKKLYKKDFKENLKDINSEFEGLLGFCSDNKRLLHDTRVISGKEAILAAKEESIQFVTDLRDRVEKDAKELMKGNLTIENAYLLNLTKHENAERVAKLIESANEVEAVRKLRNNVIRNERVFPERKGSVNVLDSMLVNKEEFKSLVNENKTGEKEVSNEKEFVLERTKDD